MTLIFSRIKNKPMKKRPSFQIPWYLRLLNAPSKSKGNRSSWMSPILVCSCAVLLMTVLGCSSKDGATNDAQTAFSNATAVQTSSSDLHSFLAAAPTLTNFSKVMHNIHSLKTFTKVSSKQVILFAPADQAFEKLGDAEKEKLLDPSALKERHQVFKNSLVLHNKKVGEWNGQGETYGGDSINVNLQSGKISFKNKQARILQQINLEGGHLIYIVDNLLT